MRLSHEERFALHEETAKLLGPASDWCLYLHGSRTDDSRRGGDIDLLLVCNKELAAKALAKKIDLLLAWHARIGEQRIDLVIACKEDLGTDPFLRLIWPKAQSLP